MPDYSFFKKAFDDLATDGKIGAPSGSAAYAYIRVSSSGQAEEGRSGLPRQIEHCHQTAIEHNLNISWDMVFADDHSGFEFDTRPGLSRLRKELKSPTRRSDYIVVEHLDRLSRNADWHQGFLLEEVEKCGATMVFWKSFSGRIERTVMGAIAQDGMEYQKERMVEGKRLKAKSGRIPTNKRAYGFVFVDEKGGTSLVTKQNAYYAHHLQEKAVVERIFMTVAMRTCSLRSLVRRLNEEGVPGPRARWALSTVYGILTNPVYKGEYVYGRNKSYYITIENEFGELERKIRYEKQDKEKWIVIPVPPIVSAEVWELANQTLEKNRQLSKRNGKRDYLLSGLLRCAICGRAYCGQHHKESRIDYYRCNSHGRRQEMVCTNKFVPAARLERAIWKVVCRILLDPQSITKYLDSLSASERNQQLLSEAGYIERQLTENQHREERAKQAYLSGVFSVEEFREEREAIQRSSNALLQRKAEIAKSVITEEGLEQKKRHWLMISEQARQYPLGNAPFELRQRSIRLVIDKVTVNTHEGIFTVDGIVPGVFQLSSVEGFQTNRSGLLNLRFRCAVDDEGDILSFLML